MNIFEEFNKEFIKRHDFYSDELNLLQKKWPNIKFENIPEAWILPIEECLNEFKQYDIYPAQILQFYGQLSVVFKNSQLNSFTEKQLLNHDRIYKNTLLKIKKIDEDLYLFCDIEYEDILKEWIIKMYNKYPVYH